MTSHRLGALAARLHESRGADLLRYLRQRLRSDAAARDIAQEAYLRFIRLGDPERIENSEAYLFRIAKNLLWEHELKARGTAAANPLEETLTAEYTPFDLACSEQVAQRLRRTLDVLPLQQRTVLLLHLRDGLTYEQIGSQAGISISMVKKHLRNAIVACRRRLRDVNGERG